MDDGNMGVEDQKITNYFKHWQEVINLILTINHRQQIVCTEKVKLIWTPCQNVHCNEEAYDILIRLLGLKRELMFHIDGDVKVKG